MSYRPKRLKIGSVFSNYTPIPKLPRKKKKLWKRQKSIQFQIIGITKRHNLHTLTLKPYAR